MDLAAAFKGAAAGRQPGSRTNQREYRSALATPGFETGTVRETGLVQTND
jgi:hypothetical protein